MSRKPEQRLNDRLRDNVRRYAKGELLMERIENSAAAGTPDTVVLARRTRKVTFAEHKVARWPKRENGRIQFLHPPTIEQLNWHLRWTQGGGHSIFIIGMIDDDERPSPPGFAVVWPGSDADNVKEITMSAAHNALKDYEGLLRVYVKGRVE